MSRPAGVVDGLLAGRYRLVAHTGSSPGGDVWRARDERLHRDVAVTVLQPGLAADDDARARFRAQARAAGRICHPGIAAVVDVAEREDDAWFVAERVEGTPLRDLLRLDGPLPSDRVLDVVEQVASALEAAHDRDVVHGGLTPSTLLVRPDGRVSVTGIGLAHADAAAVAGSCDGAPYLSPEQVAGRPVTSATDLYALGVVAAECLSDGPADLPTDPPPGSVPDEVARLVRRLLAEDPAARPASAQQVRHEVSQLRRDLHGPPPSSAAALQPVSGRPPGLGLAGRPGQRRAVRATAAALGLLAVVLGVRDATRDDPYPPGGLPERPPVSSEPSPPARSQPTPVVQPTAPVPDGRA